MEESTSILIIGRNRTLNAQIADLLEEAGYGAHIAQGTSEGLSALSRRGFRAAILAGGHNGPDQLSLCTIVREVSRLPIIVLGIDGGPYAAFQFLEAGADVYIPDPYRMNELMARIRALLRRRRQEDSGRSARTGARYSLGPGRQAPSTRQSPNQFHPFACMVSGCRPVFLALKLAPGSGGTRWSCLIV